MDTEVTAGLTVDEEKRLIELLGKVGQPWTLQFAEALMPLVATTAVEFVPLRQLGDGTIEVWVHERETGDYYAGEFATPGSVLRGNDPQGEGQLAFFGPILRIVTSELGNPTLKVVVSAGEYFGHTPRCPHLHRVFVAVLETEPTKPGKWVLAEHLPDNFTEHLRIVVDIAVRKFKEMMAL